MYIVALSPILCSICAVLDWTLWTDTGPDLSPFLVTHPVISTLVCQHDEVLWQGALVSEDTALWVLGSPIAHPPLRNFPAPATP